VSDIEVLRGVRREDVENALDHWKKVDPATRRAVLNGRELALAGGVADAETLVGLRRAVEAGTRGVMELVSLVASVLIERDETAFSLVRELAASPTAQGRVGALLCMPPHALDVLVRPILGMLLNDRSKKVREMAIDWIDRHSLKQYLPLLEALLADESNPALKELVARAISLITNGYYVRREGGAVFVTIKMKVGIYGGAFDPEIARGLSDREIAEKFVSMNP